MTEITLRKIDPDKTAPLYERYRSQTLPQPAWLELDEDGVASFCVDGEVGGAVPADVWSNRTLRWSVPVNLTASQANKHLDAVAPLLVRVHAGHEVVWDGRNLVGKLDSDAADASEEVGAASERLEGDLSLWDSSEWLLGGRNVVDAAEAIGISHETDDAKLAELAESWEAEAAGDGVHFEDDVREALIRMREELREAHAAAELEGGGPKP